ncbi:MAG: asparaginase domain-containing protein [Candidatus Aenigmatarchaeota archaeon]
MPEEKPAIHFILTGGTIDSFYDGTKDTVVPLKHSAIPSYVKNLKIYEKTEFTEVCMKDSRELTREDLKNILKTVEESPHKKIIITHGTYTMPDSARYLKANLKRKDQTIIFTGSMIPLTGFAPSDASFSLGYSIAEVQKLAPGIYVCMNGTVFSPEEVSKLISQGRFISIFGEK